MKCFTDFTRFPNRGAGAKQMKRYPMDIYHKSGEAADGTETSSLWENRWNTSINDMIKKINRVKKWNYLSLADPITWG